MDRDRRLAEMMGLCKHRGIWGGQGWVCYKCKEHIRLQNSHGELNPDFSTPEWRAKLMDWAVGEEWWDGFVVFVADKHWFEIKKYVRISVIYAYLWRNLATLIVEYHGEGRK